MPKPPKKVPSKDEQLLDQFLGALRQQESGGNYKVVNSIGALGAYQILRSNLPGWSKMTFGHSISEAEFLSHPEEQDAIARHMNAPRLKKYGPAGTAALWYSGQPDPTKRYGHPPVYKYVASVLALMGKAGNVTGGKDVNPADDTSGSTITTAGLQQAGYEAVIDLTPWGIPLNPFKMPGWLAGKLGEAGGDAAGGLTQGMWDSLGPVILAALGVAAGGGAILLGLYVTAKPTVDKASEQVAQAATVAAPEAAPLAAAAAL